MTNPHRETGARIQDLRRAAGRRRGERLTQKVLAERVGVAESTVIAWEVGKQLPRGGNLVRLAREIEAAPDVILYGDSKRPIDINKRLTELEERVRRIEHLIGARAVVR